MKTATLNYTGLGLIVLISLYYVFSNVPRYFDFSVPANAFGANPFRPFLLVHITASTVAMLAGPLQFIPAIRNRYPHWHRTQGKVYLISVLIGALTGMYLAIAHNIITDHRYTFGTGIAGLSIAWLLTSGMAFWAIKSRDFGLHEEWMFKSFVVTIGFTTFRFVGQLINGFFPIDPGETSGIMAWACWSVPLLITEFVLQRNKLASRNRTHKSRSTRQLSEQPT